jgi:gamma-glutamyltranspeptidase/glutathione hydrolase
VSKPVRRVPTPNAMIVAPQPEAVNAGAEVLMNGGNAVDAALACALVQGVADPLMSGIGGFGIMHVYDPATKTQAVWTGLGACPGSATEDMWLDRYVGETTDGFGFIVKDYVNETGAAACSVPPILRVFEAAHRRFGKLAWGDLFEPAIDVAAKGWLIRPHVYTIFLQDEAKYGRMNYGDKLAFTESGRRLYVDAQGAPKRLGSKIVNSELADTLRAIARDGADTFFSGALASHLIAEIKAHGGLLSLEDLRLCKAEEDAPLDVQYRGRRFSAVPAPGGGIYVAQLLKMLEQFDLVAMGHNSPEYIRVLAEAMKIAGIDKDRHVADPRFVEIPVGKLLSDDYAKDCAARIRRGEKANLSRDSNPDSKHTTHVSCVDRNGLVVSMTHTLGNPSGFIAKGTGFMMNGAMSTFDPRPGRVGSIAPGKRRISTMCPSIVFEGADPVMTLGAPGASWIGPGVTQVAVNVLDWGMGIQEAIMAPRVVATSNAIDISNRIPTRVERHLEGMGYEVRRTALSYAFSGVHGITMWSGALEGGADPQRDGMAVGVTV